MLNMLIYEVFGSEVSGPLKIYEKATESDYRSPIYHSALLQRCCDSAVITYIKCITLNCRSSFEVKTGFRDQCRRHTSVDWAHPSLLFLSIWKIPSKLTCNAEHVPLYVKASGWITLIVFVAVYYAYLKIRYITAEKHMHLHTVCTHGSVYVMYTCMIT